jgi:hypothetical protein
MIDLPIIFFCKQHSIDAGLDRLTWLQRLVREQGKW